MKSTLVLCVYVWSVKGWNVGTTPSFHHTSYERAAKTLPFSSTARHYRNEDDENVEKLMTEGRGVRKMLRRRRLARREKNFSSTARKYRNEDDEDVEKLIKEGKGVRNMLKRRRSARREKKIAKDMLRKKLHRQSKNYVESISGDVENSLIVELNDKNISPSKFKAVVKNVHELRTALLDRGMALDEVEFDTALIKTSSSGKGNVAPLHEDSNEKDGLQFDHEVLELIKTRAQSNSKPGSRAVDDKAQLALSIEGGGMRGAVSAGMAGAIACLGLFDTFDSIYGSSAGSVVGAYMVSRQMCVDVYTEVLTAAKTKFVSKGRLLSYLARGMLDQAMNETVFTKDTNPAMNISYVLDSIMDPESGIRPLDIEHFRSNDKKQPLRIVASTVRDGLMEVSCLGSKEMDFFHDDDVTRNVDGAREGLFACLQTSMTVPAACGPPLDLLRNQDAKANITSCCFDAFCFEPIPYRSAVEEGATHVLALRTRPHGVPIQTKPGFFERIAAPNYFESHNMPKVSEFFKKGGQQYIYAEDYLTLDEGLNAGKYGTLIPPPKLLYGVEHKEEESHIKDRSNWKRAHLLPVVVPDGNTEHPVLSVDRDEVLHAVRQGFSVAFDMLAPISGIELEEHLTGERVSKLIFASNLPPTRDVLKEQIYFSGDSIVDKSDMLDNSSRRSVMNFLRTRKKVEQTCSQHEKNRNRKEMESMMLEQESASIIGKALHNIEDTTDAIELLASLPGFQAGKLECLSQGLHEQINKL